jgi:RNA polymerase sigma-70 factor (ECF subfamily)
MQLYSPLVEFWCQQMGLRDADVADVRQDVFVAVSCGLATFHHDSQSGSFRGWLRTITRRKVCDHWRRNQPSLMAAGGSDAYNQLLNVPAQEADDSDDVVAPVEQKILYRRALDLIATDFEANTWQAFWQVVIEGQRPAEVAAALHMSVNAVYLAKARILARLRGEFEELLHH